MTEARGTTLTFDDAGEYERFMGRWSRAVAPVFLRWLEAPRHAAWLDVGCGTGILTQTLAELCAPASVHAVDSSAAQVRSAARGMTDSSVSFEVADACSLPFPNASFDVAASGLVINFITQRSAAIAEMRRVVRADGLVAGYVWDFANELSPSGPLRKAMRRVGAQVPAIPGTDASRPETLCTLFESARLEGIQVLTIDVCLAYANFDDFWTAQTPGYAPTTKVIAAMKESERKRLKRAVELSLASGPDASIEYFARANAIKSTVPADGATRTSTVCAH